MSYDNRVAFQRGCPSAPALLPWNRTPNNRFKAEYMYAVIETGGKQYRVTPGQTIDVDTLAGEVGSAVEFDRVLAVSNDTQELLLGDAVKSARVRGKISAHGRGDKVIVFKFKRKKQYKRTIGHRQNYTRVAVEEILA